MQIRLKQKNSGTVSIKHATYITTDHLLTPRLGTDESQAIVWQWDGDAFGQTRADKDPDANEENRSIRLRFPGQYHDGESGLYYNWNRYYDPKVGRYITSDPIGLSGGPNVYLYVNANPNRFADPMGLFVQGKWIKSPRFNINDVGVDDWGFIAPSVSEWGYLHFIRLYGHAKGYVNIDVECTDGCGDWEIHDRISISTKGSLDVGPNLPALGAGYGVGPYAGIMTNIVILGATALQAEHHYLNLAEQKAGPIIASALANGPTLMCLGSRP
ncbi:hypothetical protein N9H39_07460 [Gammaproteobacteria bacterium]|nr:hypothetical protein [Gammaproteobacteria bacterium]